MLTMDWKIGEIKQVNGEWYQCVESSDCPKCDLKGFKNCNIQYPCSVLSRKDGNEVIFKKLEKVGEPYMAHDHSRNKDVVVQDYKLYNQHACYNGHEEMLVFGLHGRVGMVTIKSKEPIKSLNCENSVEIEIKQTKEDMEEKNLKPFDLQKAKDGKPVCTRDEQKARIICFDKKEGFPIIALVETRVNDRISEKVALFNINGRAVSDGIDSKLDLMMSPEKKEGWVNVYMEETNNNERLAEQIIYKTRKDAFDNACPRGYKATVKIEWEE